MANILSRPMFKLGGKPNADGVGITSGLNRGNYNQGGDSLSKMQEMLPGMLEKAKTAGMISTPELALMASNVLGQGGNISEMVQNMSNIVLPRALDYQKIQASMPFKKFEALGAMSGLEIKKTQAEKETVQAAMERNAQKALALEEQYGWDMEKMKENEKDYALYKVAKQLSQRNPVSVQQARNTAMKMLEGIIRQESDAFDNFRTLDEEGRANWMQGIVDAIMTGDYSKMPSFAQGGRVGRAYGNPDPTMTETEAVDIQTPGMNEEIVATETMQAPQQPNPAQDPYIILRARLPKEITDDVVRLIAYNQEAFKDFAAIETQQDVIDFNQTYGVELVVPALTV